jgi:hypothetical protein
LITPKPAPENPCLAWLASARQPRHARFRDDGGHSPQGQCRTAPKKHPNGPSQTKAHLICWSVQEIRRIAIKLAQRRIKPAHIIAWSIWRRTHQAIAKQAHVKSNMQL